MKVFVGLICFMCVVVYFFLCLLIGGDSFWVPIKAIGSHYDWISAETAIFKFDNIDPSKVEYAAYYHVYIMRGCQQLDNVLSGVYYSHDKNDAKFEIDSLVTAGRQQAGARILKYK